MIQNTRSQRRTLSPIVWWIAVMALTFLTHASDIASGFTWLDHGDIEQKRAVLSPGHLLHAFSTRFGETGFYRPLVTLLHSLDAALYGAWAQGYHLTNVLLHVLATGAFALFLGRFLPLDRPARLTATLIAGVHPLSWLPAGAISYRPELLAALFTFLAAFFHAGARTSGCRRNAALAGACAGLAFFAKESALAWVPGLIALWECCVPNPRTGRSVFALEALALLIYAGLRLWAVPDLWHTTAVTLPLSQALGTRLASLGVLMRDLIAPTLPVLSDAAPVRPATDPAALIAAGLLIAAAFAVLRLGRCAPWTRVLLFAILALAPAFNLVPLPRFRSPHYAYLAAFGMAMAAGLILHTARQKARAVRTAAALILAVWIAWAAHTTSAAGPRFADDRALFAPEVARDPAFREGHYYLGVYLKEQGQIERAAEAYAAALEMHPDTLAYADAPSAMINLAEIRLMQNRLDEAERLLTAAADGAPAYRVALIAYDRAVVAAKQGRDEQVATLLNAPGLTWDRPEPLLLLARSLGHLGRMAEAKAVLRRSLPLLDADQKHRVEMLIHSME